jgi:hypothetical protein
MTRAPSGHRCGADHQNAKLPDSTIKAIREEYFPYVRGYAVLGKKYDASPSTIRDIVQYKTRKNII